MKFLKASLRGLVLKQKFKQNGAFIGKKVYSDISVALTFSSIMLKNDQTYFKNFTVFTTQDF